MGKNAEVKGTNEERKAAVRAFRKDTFQKSSAEAAAVPRANQTSHLNGHLS